MKIENIDSVEALSQMFRATRRVIPTPRRNLQRSPILFACNNNNLPSMEPEHRQTVMYDTCPPLIHLAPQFSTVPRRRIVGVLELTRYNIRDVIKSTELVLVLFYANFDRYCRSVLELFDEAAHDVRKEYPDTKLVVLGKVDSGSEGGVALDYDIVRYPTMKIFRNGEELRGRFRGSYFPKALKSYVTKELESPIKQLYEAEEPTKACNEKRSITGYFDNEDTTEYDNFRRIAQTLKKFGDFYVKFGNNTGPLRKSIIKFTPECTSPWNVEETFKGCAQKYEELNIWAHKMFMIQEMAYDNIEQLIEDYHPLLVLYYDPANSACIKDFKDIIVKTMMKRKRDVNFAVANGVEFTDCVEKYGKEVSDLPLVAIESPGQVFLFPHSLDVNYSEKLNKFLHEFDIGKLQYIARTGGVWTKKVAYKEKLRLKREYSQN